MGHQDREDRIRERAYAIWEGEGYPDGRALEHWEQASREVEVESSQPAADTAKNGGPATPAMASTIPQRAAERASRKAGARSAARNMVEEERK